MASTPNFSRLLTLVRTVFLFQWLATAQTPPGFSPSCEKTLDVTYPDNLPVSPGRLLHRSDVIDPPTLKPTFLQPDLTYIIFLIDPDVIQSGNATTILHWYQPDYRISSSTGFFIPPTTKGAEYVGSQPPSGSKHRYVFLLFEQPPSYVFPQCFESIFPVMVPTRAGFDIELFMRVAGLDDPVAANWFAVENKEEASTTRVVTTTSLSRAPCGATGKARAGTAG
nr:maleidride PEBP type 1 [Wicklowia aquatica]